MLKRIIYWRWFLPSFGVIFMLGILLNAWFTSWEKFKGTLLAVVVICIAVLALAVLRRYRPDVFNAYLGERSIERQPRQSPDVISALEQLTLAVEQCDDGHTPKPIHDAAARARDALDKLKPRS